MLADAPIDFLPHALQRAGERFPSIPLRQLEEEVRAAFSGGRLSGVRPAWLSPSRGGASLYAWTPDRERTYAISGGETAWHVKTIMEPSVEAA